jgi:hypothetical protein
MPQLAPRSPYRSGVIPRQTTRNTCSNASGAPNSTSNVSFSNIAGVASQRISTYGHTSDADHRNGDAPADDDDRRESYSYLQGSPVYRSEASPSAADDTERQHDGPLPRFAFMGYSAEAGPGPDTSLRRVMETPRVSPGPYERIQGDRRMTSPSNPYGGRRDKGKGADMAADPVQAGLIAEADAKPLFDL